mgnify:CR=1 FL=1
MTDDQKSTLSRLSILAALAAAALVWICMSVLFFSSFNHFLVTAISGFSIAAGLGTFFSVQLLWRLMLARKPPSKRRGLKYGIAAGILSLLLMSFIYAGVAYAFGYRSTDFLDNLFSVFLVLGLSFVFGGFLAPVLGGVVGYYSSEEANR